MEDQNKFALAQKLLSSAASVVVILPPDPSSDIVAAGLSLHLSLKSAGKKSQIGCGSEVHVNSQVKGLEEIADSIGANNLVISFDYHEDDLEKVDYDVRPDGKFYLLIKPKSGAPTPDASHVKYSYSGAAADLVITLGVNSLEELGKIYADEKSFLDGAQILSLNIHPRPASFTKNLLHQLANSFSELVTQLLEKTELKPSPVAAQNLLNTIYTETQNLTSLRLTAETFSSLAFLMRHGARPSAQSAFTPQFAQPAFFEAPAPLSFAGLRDEEESIPLPEEETSQTVPQDWTKPKIFRASDL